MHKYIKKIVPFLDLHQTKSQNFYMCVLLGLLAALALYVRKDMVPFGNADYAIFSGWYDFVKAHGLGSFKYAFSNYNPPYTYFLYIATLLPLPKMVAIKSLLVLFDLVLAVAVYFFVLRVRHEKSFAFIAALITLYLPTVLFTGVLWGQFDQFYVAFMILCLYFALGRDSKWAWMCFGVAIAIKFQAVFMLPLLGFLCFSHIDWRKVYWALGAFLVLTLPPALMGRSIVSLLKIYPDQAVLFNGQLSLNAPNLYQWFPNSAFPYLNHPAIALTAATVLLLLVIHLRYRAFSMRAYMILATLLLFLVPFLLPAMHERYFFPAGIMALVLAFTYAEFWWVVVVSQVVTLFSYTPFLFGTVVVPFWLLSIGNLIIICALSLAYFRVLDARKREQYLGEVAN